MTEFIFFTEIIGVENETGYNCKYEVISSLSDSRVEEEYFELEDINFHYGAKAYTQGLISAEKFIEIQKFLRDTLFNIILTQALQNPPAKNKRGKTPECWKFNVGWNYWDMYKIAPDPIFLMNQSDFDKVETYLDTPSANILFCEELSPIERIIYLINAGLSKKVNTFMFEFDKNGRKLERQGKKYDYPAVNMSLYIEK